MSDGRVTQSQWDRVWNTIVEVRDACPRAPGDASTDDIVAALFDAGLLAERPDRETPLAGADWRVEARQDGSILYVTEDHDGEDETVLSREHAQAVAAALAIVDTGGAS